MWWGVFQHSLVALVSTTTGHFKQKSVVKNSLLNQVVRLITDPVPVNAFI